MSTDAELVAGRLLVSRIRDAFPAEAASVDHRLRGDGFVVDEAPHIWIEHFAQRTTDALKGGDIATFQAHLELLSTVLASADGPTRKCIDVA